MIEDLGGATAQLVKLALDAAAMRHEVIATNIANVGSPNYVPLSVKFEEELASARDALLAADPERRESVQLATMRPYIEENQHVNSYGDTKIMLDLEMVRLAQNVVHYQALIDGLGKKMSIIKMAINEGNQ